MTIKFYHEYDPYGCFSNFSAHAIELDGKYWKTSEHYYQAQKVVGTPYEDKVREAPSPDKAAEYGRSDDAPLRQDWDDAKDDAMRRAVLKKFQTHADIREILLNTGDEHLVEDSPVDYYWGCGEDGSGKNMLGIVLMEIREQLRNFDSK